MQISKIVESSIISAFIGIYLLLFSIGTQHLLNTSYILSFPGSSASKESACSAGDSGSIPGLGRCSGGGHGNHSNILAWGILMDEGAWWATAHRVTKSWTQLSG